MWSRRSAGAQVTGVPPVHSPCLSPVGTRAFSDVPIAGEGRGVTVVQGWAVKDLSERACVYERLRTLSGVTMSYTRPDVSYGESSCPCTVDAVLRLRCQRTRWCTGRHPGPNPRLTLTPDGDGRVRAEESLVPPTYLSVYSPVSLSLSLWCSPFRHLVHCKTYVPRPSSVWCHVSGSSSTFRLSLLLVLPTR